MVPWLFQGEGRCGKGKGCRSMGVPCAIAHPWDAVLELCVSQLAVSLL